MSSSDSLRVVVLTWVLHFWKCEVQSSIYLLKWRQGKTRKKSSKKPLAKHWFFEGVIESCLTGCALLIIDPGTRLWFKPRVWPISCRIVWKMTNEIKPSPNICTCCFHYCIIFVLTYIMKVCPLCLCGIPWYMSVQEQVYWLCKNISLWIITFVKSDVKRILIISNIILYCPECCEGSLPCQMLWLDGSLNRWNVRIKIYQILRLFCW